MITANDRLIAMMDAAIATENAVYAASIKNFERSLVDAQDFDLAWELCKSVRQGEIRRLFAARLHAARKNGAPRDQDIHETQAEDVPGNASTNAAGRDHRGRDTQPLSVPAVGALTSATRVALNPAHSMSPIAAASGLSETGVAARLGVARSAWSPHLRYWADLTIEQLHKAAATDEQLARFKRLLIDAAERRTHPGFKGKAGDIVDPDEADRLWYEAIDA